MLRCFLWLLLWISAAFSVQAQFISHGPVVGALTDTSARIYIRTYQPEHFELELTSSSGEVSRYPLKTGTENDQSVIANVKGLTAATLYRISFRFQGGMDSLNGSFKTFPKTGSRQPLLFTTGSCQESENMKTFDRMAALNPDLFIHTGDFSYPSYQMGNEYPEHYTAIEESYRRRYQEKRMKEMLRTVPMDYIPDDDDGWGAAQSVGVARVKSQWTTVNGKKQTLNTVAMDTYPEHWRTNCFKGYKALFPGYPLAEPTHSLHHAYVVGNCEFFVLDTRATSDDQMKQFRYDPAQNRWHFAPSDSVHIISREQMEWLKQGLLQSKADWKFLVCGLPFNRNIRHLIDLGVKLQDVIYGAAGESGSGFRIAVSFATYWAGYPGDQQELLNFIQQHQIKDVLVISGDTHHNVLDDGTNAGLPEMNASGLAVAGTHLAYYMNVLSMATNYPGVKKYLWNGGGGGLGNKNFKNQFGKIEVEGNQAVRMSIVDEDGITLASQTIPHSSQGVVAKKKVPLYQKRLNRLYGKKTTPWIRFLKAMARLVYKPEKKK